MRAFKDWKNKVYKNWKDKDIYSLFFFTFIFLLLLLGSQELALEGGYTITALTWRIVMTWYCYDTSTDLTPEQRVYIDHLTSRT